MKVVLDTNVIMSAIFFGGIPREILTANLGKKFRLVLSPLIFEEYLEVAERLSAKHHAPYEKVLQLIATHSEMVADLPLPEPVSNDPDDEKFIAVALASKAKIICSGDKHLLNVDGYKGIEILKPKPFSDKYLKKK